MALRGGLGDAATVDDEGTEPLRHAQTTRKGAHHAHARALRAHRRAVAAHERALALQRQHRDAHPGDEAIRTRTEGLIAAEEALLEKECAAVRELEERLRRAGADEGASD
jgi:hypothetical protein